MKMENIKDEVFGFGKGGLTDHRGDHSFVMQVSSKKEVGAREYCLLEEGLYTESAVAIPDGKSRNKS